LKQALKQWHKKLDNVKLSNKLKINEVDKCVYVKNTNKCYIIIYLYVDDILILGNKVLKINYPKKMLTNKFNVKDLGVVDVIQRIKISRTSNGLIISQSYYIEKILDKFSKGDNSIVKTPIDIGIHMSKNKGKRINQLEYYWIIRSLMYAMNYTKPDITYFVSKLSRFTGGPSMDHWKLIKKR